MDEWYIDDVLLQGPCTPPTGGLVAGSVYAYSTHAALTGATVSNQDGYTRTAQATPGDARLDESFYVLYSPVGSKTFTATMSGYMPAVVDDVPVVAGKTGKQDFYFGTAFISQQTGDWSGSAWISGMPGAADWVTITTGHTVTVDIEDAACYNLTIMPGAVLIVPEGHQLTVEGEVHNGGTLRQTKNISGTGAVDFHLRDSAGTIVYYGLLFDATGFNMGTTVVEINGAVISGTGTLNATLRRWFNLTPQNPPTNVPTTFYYDNAELNGNSPDTLDVYHYQGGGVWDLMTTSARGGSGAARYVTAEIGPDFSAFVLKSPDAPTVIATGGIRGQGSLPVIGLMALAMSVAALSSVRALWLRNLHRGKKRQHP